MQNNVAKCNIIRGKQMAIRFKETLRWLRKKSGLTQKELGELVNYSAATVTKWEKGALEPNFETLEKIAKLYGIEPGDLLSGWDEVET